MGQLTDLGASQAAGLGHELRRRYASTLLDPTGSLIEARTTNVARCVATLSAVLGSMLPDTDEAIPVRTVANHKEYLTPNARSCERVGFIMLQGKRAFNAAAVKGETEQKLIRELRGLMTQSQLDAFACTQEALNFVRLRDWAIARRAHE